MPLLERQPIRSTAFRSLMKGPGECGLQRYT
jgi:hypothetical protein